MDLKTIIGEIHKYEKIMYGHLDEIDYYNNHGQLPQPKVEITPETLEELSVWDLIAKRANNASRISRNKTKAHMAEVVSVARAENEKIEDMLKALGSYKDLVNG